MQQEELGEAIVIIFDPVRGNMLTTRSIIHGMGFRKIEGITSFEVLTHRLNTNDVSILFIEASDNTEVIIELIQAIRMGATKCNPFLPIIATLWVGTTETVTGLLNAGSDDVLLRPFSVLKTEERVKSIIYNRKRFVVTSDYVGPDRGKPLTGRATVDSFEVPNPLKEVVTGESIDTLKINHEIDKAKKRVYKERLAKLARRIAIAAEVIFEAEEQPTADSEYVQDLINTAYELVRTAKRMNNDDIIDMAIVLDKIIAKIERGENIIENTKLIKQMGYGIYAAYVSGNDDNFKKDLEHTLTRVRGRLEKAKDRDNKLKDMADKIEKEEQEKISEIINTDNSDDKGKIVGDKA